MRKYITRGKARSGVDVSFRHYKNTAEDFVAPSPPLSILGSASPRISCRDFAPFLLGRFDGPYSENASFVNARRPARALNRPSKVVVTKHRHGHSFTQQPRRATFYIDILFIGDTRSPGLKLIFPAV